MCLFIAFRCVSFSFSFVVGGKLCAFPVTSIGRVRERGRGERERQGERVLPLPVALRCLSLFLPQWLCIFMGHKGAGAGERGGAKGSLLRGSIGLF